MGHPLVVQGPHRPAHHYTIWNDIVRFPCIDLQQQRSSLIDTRLHAQLQLLRVVSRSAVLLACVTLMTLLSSGSVSRDTIVCSAITVAAAAFRTLVVDDGVKAMSTHSLGSGEPPHTQADSAV